MSDRSDAELAAEVREIWATPGMDDPAWVAQQLLDRGYVVFQDGERFEPSDPVGAAVIANVWRWAILGGNGGEDDEVVTAAQLNKGRLVSMIIEERKEDAA